MTTIKTHRRRWAITEMFLILCYLLIVFYLYFQGLFKLAAFGSYKYWLAHAPILKNWVSTLQYTIPIAQLMLAGMFSLKRTAPAALIMVIISQILFIAWVAFIFYYTPCLIWPWLSLFKEPTWFQKFVETLIVSWLALILLNNHKAINYILFRNRT